MKNINLIILLLIPISILKAQTWTVAQKLFVQNWLKRNKKRYWRYQIINHEKK